MAAAIASSDAVVSGLRTTAHYRATLARSGTSIVQVPDAGFRHCEAMAHANVGDFATINEIYARHMPTPAPARVIASQRPTAARPADLD